MISVRDAGRRASRRIARVLSDSGFSRARWPRSYALLDVAFEPLATFQDYDPIYSARTDPWEYLSNPQEQKRYRLALEMLDRARKGRRFETVLEIGCSEGAFSEMLVGRCSSLLAVDFSPVALDRARHRRRWKPEVSFQLYDLRREPPPGGFELVLAMDILTAFRRPRLLRAAFEKVIDSVRPGGYLLVTEHRQHPVFERAWWARRLLRGGKWIVSALADQAELAQSDGCCTETHVLALFRRHKNPA